MVGEGRVELPRPCGHSALNATCLPISPLAPVYFICSDMSKIILGKNSAGCLLARHSFLYLEIATAGQFHHVPIILFDKKKFISPPLF